jgi:hypothetical protein
MAHPRRSFRTFRIPPSDLARRIQGTTGDPIPTWKAVGGDTRCVKPDREMRLRSGDYKQKPPARDRSRAGSAEDLDGVTKGNPCPIARCTVVS